MSTRTRPLAFSALSLAALLALSACGGSGFLSENRLTGLRADLDVYATFEGDNTVLMQLVAKRLLGDFAKGISSLPAAGKARWAASRAAETVLGEALAGQRPSRSQHAETPEPAEREWSLAEASSEGTYVFLAGEAASIKAWRRMCVDGAGIDRSALSFMGYWRQGQAES